MENQYRYPYTIQGQPYNFGECKTLANLRNDLPNRYSKKMDLPWQVLQECYGINIHNTTKFTELPRVMLDIKDVNIREIAQQANPTEKFKKYQHTINNIDTKDIICECKNGTAKKKILFEKILDKTDPTIKAMAWGNCKHTIFSAAKRQLKLAPVPDEKMAYDFIEYSKRMIDKYIGEDLKHFGYSLADWMNHLPKNKQDNMLKIQKIINGEPIDIDPKERRQLLGLHYQGICKIEIQELDGKTRMVCSIPDLVKYVMGPITWQLEELCAKKFPGYCGGKNLNEMEDEINELIDQGYTKVVEGDGSAFDNTQDVLLKEIDRYIYRKVMDSVYHVPKDLFQMISQSYYKSMDIMFMDETRKLTKMMTYHVLGTVFSGDCDTTLCNTLRMALYNHYTNEHGGLKYEKDFKLFSKGDDFSVLYRSHIPDTLIRRLYNDTFLPNLEDTSQPDTRHERLGQICKFLDIGGPADFKFCSLRSWFKDDQHIILTRNPSKFFNLSHYSRKIKSMNALQRKQYLYDQALALERSYKGIKIFDVMINAYRQAADKIPIPPKLINKVIKIKQGDNRQHFNENLHQNPTQLDPILYDIQHREKQYKIGENYWETMQKVERARETRETPQQLQRINEEIEKEFSSEELAALLSVNKY
jgi:hypothetical protein